MEELGELLERWPDLQVLAHPDEEVLGVTGTMEPDETIEAGGLTVGTLHTPGHTSGMLALLVEGNVFTGDTLFKGSVGGVRAPGSTSYADLKHSVMDVLLTLPDDTVIRPGHTDPIDGRRGEGGTTASRACGAGSTTEGTETVTVWDKPATLVLWGDDYDGGHKAWIRWEDGADDIVGGSQVQRNG